MRYFANKRICITGASSGIGEALAYELARLGAELILIARTESKLQRVLQNCHNPPAHHIKCIDLEDLQGVEDKVKSLWETYGPIDILINNAGISQRYLAVEGSVAVDRTILTVNFLGTVAFTRPILQSMLLNGTGHIVCVSSILGLIGKKNRTIYSASKHALRGYFESLRSELRKTPILITMIYPGYINTNLPDKALLHDGRSQGKVEETHTKGLDVAICARRILRAISAEKKRRSSAALRSESRCLWRGTFPDFFG